MNFRNFVPVIGIILNVSRGDNCCSQMVSLRTENGQNFTCSPGGRVLLVYYTTTNRSLPPQTTPRRIIVMCEED